MVKKRRLTDLYVVGKEIVLDDGRGDPITVWLQKLNPIEHETAMRRAAGVRARVSAGKDQAEVEMAEDEAAQLGREGWIEYLISDTLSRKLQAIEAEVAAEEEWSEDGYLQGLKDVWEASMKKLYEDEPEAPEAIAVKERLQEFQDALEKRIEGERDSLRKDYESKSDEDLLRRASDKLMATRADLAWLTEFRKCEVWLATREPENHREKYFTSREELDDLSHEAIVRLMTEYSDLNLDPNEGKDLGETQTSSPSSETPERPEAETSSSPEE
jgi:hypothetical protein